MIPTTPAPASRRGAARAAAALAAVLSLAALPALGGCGAAGGPPAPGAPWTGPGPGLAGCPLFPPDDVWNTRVDHLPVTPFSAAYVASIGASTHVHPDFGAGTWQGSPIGIPFAVVGPEQAGREVEFGYADESDPGPYPIPPDPPIEGGGDRHVILVQRGTCTLYELFAAERGPSGWTAGSGAAFDLTGYALRPRGWTSADAAGLPILPGLVRYDEVAAGAVRHALRFTAPRTRDAYVWPARHAASDSTDPDLPPMGQRFRLRADFDASGFSEPARVIVTALKRYGMMLADNGSAWYLSGAPDDRWDDDALRDLAGIRGDDFEAVDATVLLVDPDSGRAAP